MNRFKPTLAESIQTLARRTQAPETFVDRVRTLFEARGISLESSAEPFREALEDAFQRHARVRRSLARAQSHLGEMQAQLEILGSACRERLVRLREIRRGLERHGVVSVLEEGRGEGPPREHRGVVVRGDFELTIVPGPDGVH